MSSILVTSIDVSKSCKGLEVEALSRLRLWPKRNDSEELAHS